MRVVPADRVAELDRRARAVRLVTGRVGAVVQHAVLDVDEPGEGQVGEHRLAVGGILHETEEHAIGVQHLTALHEREPVVQALADRAFGRQRFLIGPVHLRLRRVLVHRELVEPGVVAGRLAEELVPRIETGRHVPHGLGHRQPGQLGPDHRAKMQPDPFAQQAVVVVDELHHAVVEALVKGDVGVGRVDAHRLPRDLGDWPSLLHEAVQRLTRALLIPRQDSLFQTRVVGGGDGLGRDLRRYRHGGATSEELVAAV